MATGRFRDKAISLTNGRNITCRLLWNELFESSCIFTYYKGLIIFVLQDKLVYDFNWHDS